MIGGGGPTVQGKKTREKGENWEVSGSRTPTIRPPVQSIRVPLSICVDAHLLLMIVLLQLAVGVIRRVALLPPRVPPSKKSETNIERNLIWS